MKINVFVKISIIAVMMAAVACVPHSEVDFNVDQSLLEIGAEGGELTFNVTSSGSWVAMTESPWISVSPANGKGSQLCQVKIDSTLLFQQQRVVYGLQYIFFS